MLEEIKKAKGAEADTDLSAEDLKELVEKFKKVVKSEYLKETSSVLPLTLLTIVFKGIFSFLITSRLQTDIYILDNLVSLIVTICFTLSSPFLYNVFNKSFKTEVDRLNKAIIDSFWLEGWDFYEYWKVRIFGTIGLISMILLFFIEINSRISLSFIR